MLSPFRAVEQERTHKSIFTAPDSSWEQTVRKSTWHFLGKSSVTPPHHTQKRVAPALDSYTVTIRNN